MDSRYKKPPSSGGNLDYTYTWDFGDGQSGAGQTATHVYSSAGSYTAKVTATDSANATGSVTVGITVTSGSSLTIAATASPTSSAHAPLTVTFSCSASGGTAPYSYLWDFGDGASSTEANTTHTYNSVGTFTAKVIVGDFNGNTAEKNFMIKIGSIQHPNL